MKYIVIKEFEDIYTHVLYKVNDELELTLERANEILSVDKFIKKITKSKTTKRVVE